MMPLSSSAVPGARPPVLGGRYVVTRLLGKGAQAQVYLGFDQHTARWRALKVLSERFVDDQEIRRRFRQEGLAMARLQHEHLLKIFDVGTDGPSPFLVMSLARGGALTTWMRRHGALPPRLAVRVVGQVASGLSYAHQEGVIHRDVKPQNMLIMADGRVVLTDFGVARDSSQEGMTVAGTVMGTYAYMAPEQRNDAKGVDGRADVYSLGATLYTLLTGRASTDLFAEDDSLFEALPVPLPSVVKKACAYRPEDRFQTMGAFRKALAMVGHALPQDPRHAPLTEGLLELSKGPPRRVEPAAFDELRRVIARDVEQPTYVPSSAAALAKVFEDQATTLYHDSSAMNVEDAPTVMVRPEVMSQEGGVVLNAPQSEEGIYSQVSTISTKGREHRPDLAEHAAGIGKVVVACVVASAALGLSLVGYGSVRAGQVEARVEAAEVALIQAARGSEAAVAALAGQGVEEAWFSFDEAPSVPSALTYAEVVSRRVAGVELDPLVQSHVAPLEEARGELAEAQLAVVAFDSSLWSHLSLR